MIPAKYARGLAMKKDYHTPEPNASKKLPFKRGDVVLTTAAYHSGKRAGSGKCAGFLGVVIEPNWKGTTMVGINFIPGPPEGEDYRSIHPHFDRCIDQPEDWLEVVGHIELEPES
jgi:hypothetical protein